MDIEGGSEPFEVERKFCSHNLQLSKISSFSFKRKNNYGKDSREDDKLSFKSSS